MIIGHKWFMRIPRERKYNLLSCKGTETFTTIPKLNKAYNRNENLLQSEYHSYCIFFFSILTLMDEAVRKALQEILAIGRC